MRLSYADGHDCCSVYPLALVGRLGCADYLGRSVTYFKSRTGYNRRGVRYGAMI